jgi:hypothetical protein
VAARTRGANAPAAISSSRWARTSAPGGPRRRPPPARIARTLGLAQQKQLPGAAPASRRSKRPAGAAIAETEACVDLEREGGTGGGGYSEAHFSGARSSLCALLPCSLFPSVFVGFWNL